MNSGISVEIRNLSKRYGTVGVLDDVFLAIREREFVTLLGPSGCGKTTLLKVLAGFVQPSSGHILWQGVDFGATPPHRRNIGMVFQNYALFPHMTVEGNVAYPLVVRGVGKHEIGTRVAAMLSMVGLSNHAGRRIDQISGGQRQRVALARALIFEPRLLLLDEPLSALDKQMRERTQHELRRIHDRLNMTTICVTHDQTEALTMSDKIAVMGAGRIVQFGSPREIYDQPAAKFIAEFIGETSFLPATAQGTGVVAAGRPLRTAISVPVSPTTSQCWVAIRPEKVRFLHGPDPDLNCFEGIIRSSRYRGDCLQITVELEGGESVMARGPTSTSSAWPTQPGERVLIGVHAQDTVVVFE